MSIHLILNAIYNNSRTIASCLPHQKYMLLSLKVISKVLSQLIDSYCLSQRFNTLILL